MSRTARRFTGLILAAGRGSRMQGHIKQLLPWPTDAGEVPLICAAFDSIADWCSGMIVVLGHEAEQARRALGSRLFVPVDGDPDGEMFDSIRAGLRAALEQSAEQPVLLQPGDHPMAPRTVMRQLVDTWAEEPGVAVLPEHQGRGGHPAIIPQTVAPRILEWTGSGGLRQFWLEHADLVRRIAVDAPGITLDLDTPEQYDAARRSVSLPEA